MTSTTAAVRASVAVLAALALASCAQPGAEPTVAPDGPPPSASASAAPTASASPTASATASPGITVATHDFEAQDGAVRFSLPEGWSVDDRSAMHEGSEMYDNGPSWLNELVVLDEDGDRMLWYREDYGNDFLECREVSADAERTEITPFSEELAAARAAEGDPIGPTFALAELGEAAQFDAAGEPGEWSVVMGVVTTLPVAQDGCSDLTDVLWSGSRVVLLDVVGDAEREDGIPDPTIDFPDEQSARAWLESAEHDAIIGVLQSLELTDAPLLDAAP
ncbi:hypothetical protein [Agrococcus jenensis]|uniref:Lipoprotein n=1 Tax=Agrococcus jenensis TaxID=46353 RepID=A0A3N2ASC0_9MICO|nr:hypothetical protein [Agrococcus jenensis]ROR65943.1 hypothetical protein EDD26_1317 [Agrococcus jenensis]